MKLFLTAIPLFDKNMAVQAYRLMSRRGDKLFGEIDDFRGTTDAVESPGLDMLESVGTEPFAGDRPIMLDITHYQLVMGIVPASSVPAEALVCVLPASLPTDADTVGRCAALVKAGYTLAMEGVPRDAAANPVAQMAKYIILDYAGKTFRDDVRTLTPMLRRKNIVVGNVPDMQSIESIGRVQNALYSGTFYSKPLTRGDTEISPLKVNSLKLLNEINQDDFDLTQIAETVERDPALSISLLRFINSAATGVSRRIESIRGAVAILGQNEVRRWANVAISVGLSADRPGEITRLSLIRAKFAENLAGSYELGMLAPSLFMAGLFSMLDVILEKPMDKAISEVAVDERVRRALVDEGGPLFEVLGLVFAYERADWDDVAINMVRNGIDVQNIREAFVDALIWYKQLLETIDAEYEGELE